jgi:alpha-tubulin suppressor-like RCC1 family protein
MRQGDFRKRLLLLFPILCLTLSCDGTAPPGEAPPTLSSISAGFDRTCALSDDGSVYCWGSLGNVAQVATPPCIGTACYRTRPELVPLPFNTRELRLASDFFGDATCVISTSYQLYCWGYLLVGFDRAFLIATTPQVIGGPTVSSVQVGSRHLCGLTPAGEAYCWGDYRVGVRGTGQPLIDEFIDPDLTPNLVAGGLTFTSLAVGLSNSCGLDASGAAYCWGSEIALGNSDAPLSTESECGYSVPPIFGNCSHVPQPVSGGHQFTELAAGHAHVCGVTTSGEVYCWGSNAVGQLGTGSGGAPSATPVRALLPEPARSVALGGIFTCALAVSGQVYCWGENTYGQLGLGPGIQAYAPAPIVGAHAYREISLGYDHACGLRLSGEVDCWGLNTRGQLGTGSQVGMSSVPVQVQF